MHDTLQNALTDGILLAIPKLLVEKKIPRFTGSHHQQNKSSKQMQLSKMTKVASKLLYPAFVLYTNHSKINAVE